MQCEEFEDRLNAVLDERRRPEWDPALQLHCQMCPDCRHRAEEYRALLEGLDAMTGIEAPRALTPRVLSRLQPAHRVIRSSTAAATLAMAASLLIAFLPWTQWVGRQANVEKPAPQQLASERVSSGLNWERWPIVGELPTLVATEEPDPYAALARWTGQSMGAAVMQIPGLASSDETDSNLPVADEDASSQEFMLKPVTDSVAATFLMLWPSQRPVERTKRS
jgi:hypothetical protein